MAEAAQPAPAAETTLEDLGTAFKVDLGQADPRPRDDQGRFVSATDETPPEEGEEEIEAEAGGPVEAESQDEEQDDDEAADEAQPEDAALPASWPTERAEEWQTLPPETRAFIAEREGQRDAAVNAKFQEAANVRKANEAVIAEAQTSRQKAVETADLAIAVLQSQAQEPPLSMLDINSSDYDPDAYHMRTAQYRQQMGQLNQLASQRQQLVAQDEQATAIEAQQQVEEINRTTAPAFIKDFPDAADATKAEGFFGGLVQYALKAGAPPSFFQSGAVSAVEWHIIAKARKYDEQEAARAKVKTDPKPEQRRPAPALRPGVTTPRSAVENRNRKTAMDRLDRSGSVEDAAAVFKQMFKGTF